MNLNWGTFQTGDWLSGLVSTLVAYILFTFLQRFLHRNHFLRIISFQLNLLALALLALFFLTPQLAGLHRYVLSAVQAIAVFLLIVIVCAPSIFSFLISSGAGVIRRRSPSSSGISAAGLCRCSSWWS